jgi:hypothetical protein
LQLNFIPKKVFLRVGIFGEVKPASCWVSLVEGDEMLLADSFGSDEVELEKFVRKVTGYGLGDLDPWPFHGDEGVVDPPRLCNLVEFEKI